MKRVAGGFLVLIALLGGCGSSTTDGEDGKSQETVTSDRADREEEDRDGAADEGSDQKSIDEWCDVVESAPEIIEFADQAFTADEDFEAAEEALDRQDELEQDIRSEVPSQIEDDLEILFEVDPDVLLEIATPILMRDEPDASQRELDDYYDAMGNVNSFIDDECDLDDVVVLGTPG